jgi:hypothetical protein
MSSTATRRLSQTWRRGLVVLVGTAALGIASLPAGALASPAAGTLASPAAGALASPAAGALASPAAGALTSPAAAPTSAPASAKPTHFIQVATSSNIVADATGIDSSATNDKPNALLFVTALYSVDGACPCSYDTSPIGVAYGTGSHVWSIFNENGSAMAVGESFNVLVVPSSDSTAFVQVATASDSGSDATYISSPVTNSKPKVILQVTPRYAGAYENHPVGVWYSGTLWAVINEDQANMDTSGDATFNVLVGAANTGGGKTGVQKTTAANLAGDTTVVNNPTTNGDQDAFVIETPDYNPSGKGGTYDSSPTGEYYYNGSNAAIFNELGATMALKSSFDLLMFKD